MIAPSEIQVEEVARVGCAFVSHADGRHTHPDLPPASPTKLGWLPYCNCVRCCRRRSEDPWLHGAVVLPCGMVALKVANRPPEPLTSCSDAAASESSDKGNGSWLDRMARRQ